MSTYHHSFSRKMLNIPFLLLLVLSLQFLQCSMGGACPDCISLAVKIRIEDPVSHLPVENARMVVTNNFQDTLIYCDTCEMEWYYSYVDSTYQFPGGPGTYKISFSHPDYDSFTIAKVKVTQSDEYSCDYPNTQHFVIEVRKKTLSKLTGSAGYTVKKHFADGSCM